MAQLDMLLVNYASATTLPETVPTFTAYMNMKIGRLISRWKTEKDSKNKQVIRLFMDCISVC